MMIAFVAALLAVAPASAQSAAAPPESPPVTAPLTVQQQFEAASTALDAERWDEALRLFEALEGRITQNPRTLAVVRVRKAQALFRLGRREEGLAALRLGLPGLPADDRSLDADRFLALLGLGEAAELALDYAEARRHYRAAKAVAVEPRLRLAVYRGLIQTEMFEDAATALADADEGVALARTESIGAPSEGILRTMRGRVLLNMGRHAEARDELRRAMDRLGGLTSRVNLADIVARSDLAIAAMLAGRPDEARRYLAYTGAGDQQAGYVPPGSQMEQPACGDGLEPSDVGVVEFSIRDDGTVGGATPVYSSRQGQVALAFARAARRWSWYPERIRDIPLIFRSALRVELRCTLRPPEPDRSLGRDRPEAAAWLDAHGIGHGLTNETERLVSPDHLRAELARREAAAGRNSTTVLPLLIALARHPSVDGAETAGYLRRAIPIAAAEAAPARVMVSLAVHLARSAHQAAEGRSAFRERVDYDEALALPGVRDNPAAIAGVRLAEAYSLYRRNEDEEAAAMLALVRQVPDIPANDWIRMAALALETAMAAARGDRQAAEAAYRAMGANAEPCDVRPRERRVGTSPGDFPDEALRWGFEGWAAVELQVSADGDLNQPRTVMSYPPFVFDESAERVADRSRLESVYLPEGATCPPHSTLVQYRIRQQ